MARGKAKTAKTGRTTANPKAAKKAKSSRKPKKAPRTPLLTPKQRLELAARAPKWAVKGKRLVREWTLKDFDAAIALVDAVASLAQRADHHPDLHLTDYKHVRIETWSHDAGGLTDRDFSLAMEIDLFPEAAEPAEPADAPEPPAPTKPPKP